MHLNFRLQRFFFACWVICFHAFCDSKSDRDYSFMKEGTEAPSTLWYDYIIVGGGTAGIPLATTLSETSKVLVLERGGSPYGNTNITQQSGFMKGSCDHSPTSPTQHFISEDGVPNIRARVLGGGTCINLGFYGRASHDYVIRAGWDEKLVNKSYRWVEQLLVHNPVPLTLWQVAASDMLIKAGVGPDNELTYEHLVGTKIGGSIFDGRGHRHSAADLLAQANPKGITVLLHATVTKILFRHKGKERPKAYGVIFEDSTRRTHMAYLNAGVNSEIILSAGALGSPQLLMLSGIGPKNDLRSLDIEVLMDQPLVGQAITDNPRNSIYAPSPLPIDPPRGSVVAVTNHSRSYIFANIFTSPGACPWETHRPQNSSFKGTRFSAKVARPLSTGYLKLKDGNPDNNPSVTFNYFSRSDDIDACVEYLNIIKSAIESNGYSKFRYPHQSFDYILNLSAYYLGVHQSRRNANYSMALDQYCKDTVQTSWHYHGGCQVGRVVDHDYRVSGVDALRVLDASTFNTSPGTNPQATLLMLGRYMGVKIQNERSYMEKLEQNITHQELR